MKTSERYDDKQITNLKLRASRKSFPIFFSKIILRGSHNSITHHFSPSTSILKMAPQATPADNQAEVVLVGCGAPLRGMGWYHAVQMLNDDVPHAKLCHVVEPWFLGGGKFN